MTTYCVQVCGLHSLVNYFYVKTYDIWEGNVTRKVIYTEHIHSLGFQDTNEWHYRDDLKNTKVRVYLYQDISKPTGSPSVIMLH